ncbi:hypothetical protein SAMN05660477_02886 [Soonwooa buanensis]|uniref:Lipoprotein n=1 Tax=Soonwooa buanensis TaxID=619805 RepID=A0A1T5GIJ9_9FLAO|nr:hypothetical protein [Soonwooa buanensis]SKC08238.1 hypothetical protein SAMN05660477_02886 [Soonwooa buanensis]
MIRPILLTTILSLGILSCEAQKKTTTSTSNSSSTSTSTSSQSTNTSGLKKVNIDMGDYQQIAGTDLSIKYNGIIEDSRCPEGMTCVWAGVAVAELEVMTPSSRPRTIQLATTEMESRGLKKSETVYGYDISLKTVSPYPSKNEKPAGTKNSIGLEIQKQK